MQQDHVTFLSGLTCVFWNIISFSHIHLQTYTFYPKRLKAMYSYV